MRAKLGCRQNNAPNNAANVGMKCRIAPAAFRLLEGASCLMNQILQLPGDASAAGELSDLIDPNHW